MDKPWCTLFMLQSLDGKISTGAGNDRDFDKDLPKLIEGMEDYYAAEKITDEWSMISGSTCVKLGANDGEYANHYHDCSHILVDSHKLTVHGINHIADNCNQLILVTDRTMPKRVKSRPNIKIIDMPEKYSFAQCMEILYSQFDILNITVQTGGTLNSKLLREGLINEVDIFIAPVIVGGRGTPTISDGMELFSECHLDLVNLLKLKSMSFTKHGFVRLRYDITNNDRSSITTASRKFLEKFS